MPWVLEDSPLLAYDKVVKEDPPITPLDISDHSSIEKGIWEMRDHSYNRRLTYDTDDTTRPLVFPYDLGGMSESSADPSLTPCHITIGDNDPSSPSKLDHLGERLVDPDPSCQLLHSHHELQATMKHGTIKEG